MMMNLMCHAKRMMMNLENEEGQGMVEYALIIGLIAIGLVVALRTLGGNIETAFTNIGTEMNTP